MCQVSCPGNTISLGVLPALLSVLASWLGQSQFCPTAHESLLDIFISPTSPGCLSNSQAFLACLASSFFSSQPQTSHSELCSL